MDGHQIDAVYEPLETLHGLLGCLCCIDPTHDSPDPKPLSHTFFHLFSLSCDLKDALDAMIDEVESDTPTGQEQPTKKANPNKKGG